jgi:hypothetical protein
MPEGVLATTTQKKVDPASWQSLQGLGQRLHWEVCAGAGKNSRKARHRR